MSQIKPVAYLPQARCYSGPEKDSQPGPTFSPMHLAASAILALIQTLPPDRVRGRLCGTGYSIGVVLIVMMTGRLSQTKGSLARAAYPFVAHPGSGPGQALHWGPLPGRAAPD